jgi:hypothetical protein
VSIDIKNLQPFDRAIVPWELSIFAAYVSSLKTENCCCPQHEPCITLSINFNSKITEFKFKGTYQKRKSSVSLSNPLPNFLKNVQYIGLCWCYEDGWCLFLVVN